GGRPPARGPRPPAGDPGLPQRAGRPPGAARAGAGGGRAVPGAGSVACQVRAGDHRDRPRGRAGAGRGVRRRPVRRGHGRRTAGRDARPGRRPGGRPGRARTEGHRVNTPQPPTGTGEDLLDEVRLAWLEVLDVDDVSADANFLEVGGDSILLLQLWERLNELTSRNLKAADLFR